MRTDSGKEKSVNAGWFAMNRFKIIKGEEQAFEDRWARRDSNLRGVPGFVEFHLLRGPEFDDHTLYVVHMVWASEKSMEDWVQSEAFRKAPAHAGKGRNVYLGPPNLEGFNVVQTVKGRE
ncbi:MAG: antibiotic biosynthesis monooxygenase [Rhodospirillales bacterium]|jgi:heme-degrading monooxygenase HmoA|nr:antibiotic biosynthesis monooxygenase [Rhodospirillales bacterium]MDP7097735.1 antibiotic biosynthesis monooxygenase [Rhodospirillales bacterium]HIJ43629.1 antibiotic biosynthesis monooxygenase [Rhodospirillaceae bacterium]HIJ93593.1 antibiotic biosynthesis monooxygenase [Rhodospirillaceae bacterium]